MNPDYIVRAATPEDMPAITEFRIEVSHSEALRDFLRRYRPPEYFDWKFFRNPVNPAAVRLVYNVVRARIPGMMERCAG